MSDEETKETADAPAEGKVACPECGFEVEAGNTWAEVAHMQMQHPDVIDRRLREVGVLDAPVGFAEEPAHPIEVVYRNHRGEVAMRHITPMGVRFGSTAHHPEAQWLLDCYDHDRKGQRTYALKDCDFDVPPF